MNENFKKLNEAIQKVLETLKIDNVEAEKIVFTKKRNTKSNIIQSCQWEWDDEKQELVYKCY